jgi:hypothetical protein
MAAYRGGTRYLPEWLKISEAGGLQPGCVGCDLGPSCTCLQAADLKVLFLPLTRAGLRLLGFRRWKSLLERLSRPARPPRILPLEALRETALRAARAVRSAELHGPASPNCLERSPALWWLLWHRGVGPSLRHAARCELAVSQSPGS